MRFFHMFLLLYGAAVCGSLTQQIAWLRSETGMIFTSLKQPPPRNSAREARCCARPLSGHITPAAMLLGSDVSPSSESSPKKSSIFCLCFFAQSQKQNPQSDRQIKMASFFWLACRGQVDRHLFPWKSVPGINDRRSDPAKCFFYSRIRKSHDLKPRHPPVQIRFHRYRISIDTLQRCRFHSVSIPVPPSLKRISDLFQSDFYHMKPHIVIKHLLLL